MCKNACKSPKHMQNTSNSNGSVRSRGRPYPSLSPSLSPLSSLSLPAPPPHAAADAASRPSGARAARPSPREAWESAGTANGELEYGSFVEFGEVFSYMGHSAGAGGNPRPALLCRSAAIPCDSLRPATVQGAHLFSAV